MAPIKRKGNAPEETAARQPQKRAKVGADERNKDQKKEKDAPAPKASELSVLREDEPSFPRGGGSVLTPLERKQIQIQATKDVLFEQKGPKGPKKPAGALEDSDEDDIEMEDADETAPATKKSRRKKTKGKKDADQEPAEKEDVRIEGLTFKV
jgi:rRNA biogenesis protein RRP5